MEIKKLSQLLSGNDMRDGEGWKPEMPFSEKSLIVVLP